MRIATEIGKFCAIVLGLGLLFAWLGVYNTGQLPLWQRTVFWTTTMAAGAGSAMLIAPYFWSDRFEDWPTPMKIGLVAAIVSVPVTLTLFPFTRLPQSLSEVITQYVYVLIISLIVTTGMYIAETYRGARSDTLAETADPALTFLERLPVKYRTSTLYAIASEDHYLRVYTSVGEELILMRLADAIRELNGADGLQVHRSWWVAKPGISDEKRENGRTLIILPGGTEVPVSRSFRKRAKDSGFIA